MKILGIIPARFASSRFPGKSLADIAGKSMVQRVYEQVSKAMEHVVVATDDQRIFDHVSHFGKAIMTSPNHKSGTDRCNEALSAIPEDFDYIINIQGDEPFLNPEEIKNVASVIEKEAGLLEIVTMAVKISDHDKITDPNVVKVVLNKNNDALYFSRSTIPYPKNDSKIPFLQHIGLYAYRRDILNEIAKLEESELEKTESLEQLRWLEAGYSIKVLESKYNSIGIDTPKDLEEAITKKLWQTS